ncbi:universal stress protein [Saccharopolyspora gloriosae]|uniref:Nucleotide-binding universal stress UspA family protein n=1 Tax=Saccharopolyspora gloriosae TaxID=455344 RepID=A0A840NG82_9PSEU|nr:universal stress protein [Saccharopolyspora gloriosae]MBB5070011.1 nucleotide-binding universal stress UspA family protein [Saccharopolyspora gloriosae]
MCADNSLVVGIHGSESSARALRWAVREARQRHRAVRAVMVWSRHAVLSGPGPLLMNPELAPHHLHEQYRRELSRTVHACVGDQLPPGLRMELMEGRTVDVLSALSAEAAMLVLGGGHHHRGINPTTGHVVGGCLRHARCPVVIVPHDVEFAPDEQERASGPASTHDPVLG